MAAAALAGLALAAPAGAGAASDLEVALQDDAVFVNGAYYGRERGLDKAVQLGATHVRANVISAEVVRSSANRRSRPSRVVYDYSGYDQMVVEALARGLRVQLALTGPAPAWATGNRKRGAYKTK